MNTCLIFSIVVCIVGTSGQNQSDYCQISQNNTLCLFKPLIYGPACRSVISRNLTSADEYLIVSIHNEFRNKVAFGLELRGKPGPQPEASDMPALTWDDELALMADTHVRQCIFRHDANRNVARFTVGQNLAKRSTSYLEEPNWYDTIKSWYDEVANFDARTVNSFKSGKNEAGQAVGHYTQLVWSRTTRVGCSVVNWAEDESFRLLYACNYGPAGNIRNAAVYSIGNPASICPAGTLFDGSTGLCKGVARGSALKIRSPHFYHMYSVLLPILCFHLIW